MVKTIYIFTIMYLDTGVNYIKPLSIEPMSFPIPPFFPPFSVLCSHFRIKLWQKKICLLLLYFFKYLQPVHMYIKYIYHTYIKWYWNEIKSNKCPGMVYDFNAKDESLTTSVGHLMIYFNKLDYDCLGFKEIFWFFKWRNWCGCSQILNVSTIKVST